MVSSSTKKISYSFFVVVLDFSAQQKNGDLALESKHLERSHRCQQA
jgi:hypothetical protein